MIYRQLKAREMRNANRISPAPTAGKVGWFGKLSFTGQMLATWSLMALIGLVFWVGVALIAWQVLGAPSRQSAPTTNGYVACSAGHGKVLGPPSPCEQQIGH